MVIGIVLDEVQPFVVGQEDLLSQLEKLEQEPPGAVLRHELLHNADSENPIIDVKDLLSSL